MTDTHDNVTPDQSALPDPETQPTISIDEAADLLGICRASMYRAAKAGECPTVRIGRRILVKTAPFLRMIGALEEPAETPKMRRRYTNRS